MNNQNEAKLWLYPFLFWGIAGLCGVLMRLFYVTEINFVSFRNVLHAHSHLALLGWVLPATLLLLRKAIKPDYSIPQFRITYYWIIIISGLMFISFWWRGYQFPTPVFLATHQFLVYYVLYDLWKALPQSRLQSFSQRLIKDAILFQVISTIGVWALAVLVINGIKGEWYFLSIQFYLHFQLNGWLTFALLGLVFTLLERQTSLNHFNRFRLLWFLSCFLTFALSISWTERHDFIYALNSIGVILQLIAGWYLLRFLPLRQVKLLFTGTESRLLAYTGLTALAIKIMIHSVVALPYMAIMSFTIRNYVIGFVHLLMLGFISCMILTFFIRHNERSPLFRWGIHTFLAGFLTTELILFGQGLLFMLNLGFIPHYYMVILLLSILLWLGIITMASVVLFRNLFAKMPDKQTMPEL
jgi:hypothetical protein